MKKLTFLSALFIGLYLLLEICLRLVLCFSTPATFLRPSDIIFQYYPELKSIITVDVSNIDSTLDVLILSCSVLHKDWADIANELNHCIQLPQGYNRIHIYNASGIGHGSRDNLVKYGLLKDKRFDMILYYDAINDARLNNCPDSIFKNDYSHYQWYDEINHIIAHHEMNYTVIPYFLDRIKIGLKARFSNNGYIPVHFSLRPQWQQYGDHYKSLHCYEANVKAIANQASACQCNFVFLTFSYYLPADYSLQHFRNKSLDYTFCDHSRETEIWGQPQNVAGFIDSVNVQSKSWLREYPLATWIDLQTEFPKSGSYFADVCHFSPKGIKEFAAITCRSIDSITHH